jgi:HPt (histidine-containing phosphotransfer) domain-containing protein
VIASDKLPGMLRKFAADLNTKFQPDPGPEGQKGAARQAHAVAPSAEMIGFVAFAQECREIEASSAQGSDFELLLKRCRTSRDLVVRRLAELATAVGGSEGPVRLHGTGG